ncbi:hypothetical protein SH528x_005338 [Novipirellula sp. SH528]|uniref:hypothetical protein n=1 Tax=Novipirellula sp. SH528 TaxID=3454466 RepID=UPI003FA0607B
MSAPLSFIPPLANDSQLGQHDRAVQRLRGGCCGVVPLEGVLAPWMVDVLSQPSIHPWVDRFESPLNVLCEAPLEANVRALAAIADDRDLALQIHFARKANKCLRWIDAAKRLGIAIDVASDIELQQTLLQDIDPAKIICTAAVKPTPLLHRCVANGVTIVVDNADELTAIQSVANGLARPARIALRISGFQHRGQKLPSRFGVDIDEFTNGASSFSGLLAAPWLTMVGLHFISTAARSISVFQRSSKFCHLRMHFISTADHSSLSISVVEFLFATCSERISGRSSKTSTNGRFWGTETRSRLTAMAWGESLAMARCLAN